MGFDRLYRMVKIWGEDGIAGRMESKDSTVAEWRVKVNRLCEDQRWKDCRRGRQSIG